MSKIQVSAGWGTVRWGTYTSKESDSQIYDIEYIRTKHLPGTTEVGANCSYTLPMSDGFEYKPPKNSSPLCSSPKRYNPVKASLSCVADVFNNAFLFLMILGYHPDDSVYPLTDFARNMDEISFRSPDTRRRKRSKQKKVGQKRVRYESDSDNDDDAWYDDRPVCDELPMLLTLTQVCWNWYANGPNHLYREPVAVSKMGGRCHDNLRVRLSERCRAFRFVSGEVVHLFALKHTNPVLVNPLGVHMFENLHTIFLEDEPATGLLSWIHTDSVSLKTRALTLLCSLPTVRRFSILVENDEQVQLLSHMTQIHMLHLDAYDPDNDEWMSLSPLQNLTQLRYLQLKNNIFHELSTFVNRLSALEVLDTYWSCEIDSMQGLTSLRQYCVERVLYNDTLYENILTLPESNNNVDIQIEVNMDKYMKKGADSEKYELFRKLMRRFRLGFRMFRMSLFRNKLYTFAPHRWPARPGDITDPHEVDQLVQRLCGIGLCSRCRKRAWNALLTCKKCMPRDGVVDDNAVTGGQM